MSRRPKRLRAARISLGLLGIVTEVTMRCVPLFRLRLDVRRERLGDVLAQLDETIRQTRHFEFYYFPNTEWTMTKRLVQTDEPVTPSGLATYLQEHVLENYGFWLTNEASYRLPRATRRISGLCASLASPLTRVAASHEVFATERLVKFNEMEYSLPLDAYEEAFAEVRAWLDRHNRTILFPLEHRFVRGDDSLLSPAYTRNSAYIAAHAYHKKPYADYFAALESIFKRYQGRPHWGKLHARTDLREAYPEWEAFERVRQENDPEGLFLTPYLRRLGFGVDVHQPATV